MPGLLPARGRRAPRRSVRVEPLSTIRSGRSGEHRLQVRGVAAAGDASQLGPAGDARPQELELLGAIGARPSEQQLGRQRVELDRRRRPGREDALHPCGHRSRGAPPHRITDGLRKRRRAPLPRRPNRSAAIARRDTEAVTVNRIPAVRTPPARGATARTAANWRAAAGAHRCARSGRRLRQPAVRAASPRSSGGGTSRWLATALVQ